MIRRGRSLRTWVFLFLINGLVLCSGFMLLLQQSLVVLEQTAQKQTEQNLKTFAHSFITLMPPVSQSIDIFLKNVASRNPGFRITVINSDGVVIGDSDAPDIAKLENHGSRVEVRAALSGKEEKFIRQSTVNQGDVMYYAIPLRYDNKNMALRLSMPVAQSVYFTSGESRTLIMTSLLVLTVIMLVSFFVSAHVVRQIGDLRKATEQYRSGNFDYRPAVHSPRELEDLGVSVGEMALKIKNNIDDISQQRDEFQAVFKGITEGLIVFDSTMDVLEYNDTAADLFEADRKKTKPETLAQLVRSSEILKLADRALTEDKSGVSDDTIIICGEIEAELHVGEENRNVFVRCIKIHNGIGKKRFLLVLSDITRGKKLEQVRKDFVANVSHELKTPVTSIKGFTETLLDGALDDKDTARHFLEIINNQSSRLMNIIEDLLTLSRLEQSKEPMETSPADLVEAVRNIRNSYAVAAEKKHIQLDFVAPKNDIPLIVNINAGLFSQAIGNLLDNAVKYCPDGSEITCSVSMADSIDGKEFAQITVEDTGKGIPSIYRTRIFERFFRVDKGRSRENGGTGLGLSIVSHIIQLHGGTVVCVERPDRRSGARFEIRLPAVRG